MSVWRLRDKPANTVTNFATVKLSLAEVRTGSVRNIVGVDLSSFQGILRAAIADITLMSKYIIQSVTCLKVLKTV